MKLLSYKRYRASRKYEDDIFSLILNNERPSSKVLEYLSNLYAERTKQFRFRYNVFRVDLLSPKKLDKRHSNYLWRLIFRNRLRHYYRLPNNRLKAMLFHPRRKHHIFGANFSKYFQGRLDHIMLQLYFAKSAFDARVLIEHQYIKINDTLVPRYWHTSVHVGDVITPSGKKAIFFFRRNIVEKIFGKYKIQSIPSGIEFSWPLLRFHLFWYFQKFNFGRSYVRLNLRSVYNRYTSP